jgi:tetratricopeptide (TPR) repeat protein
MKKLTQLHPVYTRIKRAFMCFCGVVTVLFVSFVFAISQPKHELPQVLVLIGWILFLPLMLIVLLCVLSLLLEWLNTAVGTLIVSQNRLAEPLSNLQIALSRWLCSVPFFTDSLPQALEQRVNYCEMKSAHHDAIRFAEERIEVLRRGNRTDAEPSAVSQLAYLHLSTGNLQDAERTIDQINVVLKNRMNSARKAEADMAATAPEQKSNSPYAMNSLHSELATLTRLGAEVSYASTLAIKANICQAYRRYDEAIALHHEALGLVELQDVTEALVGEHSLGLAFEHAQVGNLDEAEKYAARGYEIFARRFPKTKVEAVSLGAVANVEIKRGRLVEAEKHLDEAWAIINHVQSDQRGALGQLFRFTGCLRVGQHRYDEAETAFKSGIENIERHNGTEHPALITILTNYVELLNETGRQSEAQALEERIAKIKAKYGIV